MSKTVKLVAVVVWSGLAGPPGWAGPEQDPGSTTIGSQDQPDDQRVFRAEITVRAPLDDVWRAWTTAEGVKSFFGRDAVIELRIGGKYEVYFDLAAPEGSRGSDGCTVLAWQPRRMLAFTWNAPPKFPSVRREHTQVVLLFDPLAADRTRVRLAQHGWGDGAEWDQVFEYFSSAWPGVMENLRTTLEDAPRGPAASAEPTPRLTQWVYLIRPPRETFMQDATEQESRKVTEHYRRLVRMLEEGRLILAGPCTDGKGPGIVVFEAESEQRAREIMLGDPAVKAGVFSAELHPFRASLLRVE